MKLKVVSTIITAIIFIFIFVSSGYCPEHRWQVVMQLSKPDEKSSPCLSEKESKKIVTWVEKESRKHKIPYSSLVALYKIESNFNPDEISWDGQDIGIGQVRYKYHCKDFGIKPKDLFDPEINIRVSAQIFKDSGCTYSKYNAGKNWKGKVAQRNQRRYNKILKQVKEMS